MREHRDYTLETLIELDGMIATLGGGFWIKIEAQRVQNDEAKPYGIKYSLTLHDARGERVLGYDNAHALPKNASIKTHDHMHRSGKIVKYEYKDAATLLEDFRKDVERIMRRNS